MHHLSEKKWKKFYLEHEKAGEHELLKKLKTKKELFTWKAQSLFWEMTVA